jgi:hypothetical protein
MNRANLPSLAILVLVSCLQLLVSPTRGAEAQEGLPGWGDPMVLFDAGENALVFKPFVVDDTEGGVNVLWEVYVEAMANHGELVSGIYCVHGDGTSWSEPIDVLVAPDFGRTYWPEHAVDRQGRVHLVWIGPDATLYYSRAPAADACDARSWVTAALPPRDGVMYGDIVVDEAGIIHVAYARSGKDVYYIRSEDDGLSWTDPVAVSSVLPTEATSFPSIAVDRANRVHIAWEENKLPDGVPALGLFYAVSTDSGDTWSTPLMFADGGHTQPSIAALPDGTTHLLWNGRITTGGRYHQWSVDGGVSWSAPVEFVPKSVGGGQTGAPQFAIDSAGTLHVVTGAAGTLSVVWANQGWRTPETIMPFTTFGNLEHQSIAVSHGNILHAVASADLHRVVWARGQSAAPKTDPGLAPRPTATAAKNQIRMTPQKPQPVATTTPTLSTRVLANTSPTPVNSWVPVAASAGAALALVIGVMVTGLRRRR